VGRLEYNGQRCNGPLAVFVFQTSHGREQVAPAVDTSHAPQSEYCQMLQTELIPLTKPPNRVL
jgi:hypothetical protein